MDTSLVLRYERFGPLNLYFTQIYTPQWRQRIFLGSQLIVAHIFLGNQPRFVTSWWKLNSTVGMLMLHHSLKCTLMSLYRVNEQHTDFYIVFILHWMLVRNPVSKYNMELSCFAGYFTHCCVKPSFSILNLFLGLVRSFLPLLLYPT